MTDWIADGESGSSVRAKLNALMTPISSVAVSSPSEHVDVVLPSGYSSFELHGDSIIFRDLLTEDIVSEQCVFLLSFDNGVTFLRDAVHGDTYILASGSTGAAIGTASYLKLQMFEMKIDGGAANRLPFVQWFTTGVGDNISPVTFGITSFGAGVNVAATVPPPSGRATTIRIESETASATPGTYSMSGTFTLFGIPTP